LFSIAPIAPGSLKDLHDANNLITDLHSIIRAAQAGDLAMDPKDRKYQFKMSKKNEMHHEEQLG
jgi:hypothetical protein